ncbi:hypothetical protein [Streptomyces sp. NPDC050264]|uniref:hypothetical protein n=1 Tax=Streptomyces sp. NPDC050264 TaxID=3155038 RepID=UPI0034201D70
MSAKTNRAKGDRDPVQWLPPFAGERCTYVADWAATKLRWQLALDPQEKAALADEFERRPNAPVEVTSAR